MIFPVMGCVHFIRPFGQAVYAVRLQLHLHIYRAKNNKQRQAEESKCPSVCGLLLFFGFGDGKSLAQCTALAHDTAIYTRCLSVFLFFYGLLVSLIGLFYFLFFSFLSW